MTISPERVSAWGAPAGTVSGVCTALRPPSHTVGGHHPGLRLARTRYQYNERIHSALGGRVRVRRPVPRVGVEEFAKRSALVTHALQATTAHTAGSVLSKFLSPVATGNFGFIWGGLASRRLEELRRLASRRNFWAVATLVPPK